MTVERSFLKHSMSGDIAIIRKIFFSEVSIHRTQKTLPFVYSAVEMKNTFDASKHPSEGYRKLTVNLASQRWRTQVFKCGVHDKR